MIRFEPNSYSQHWFKFFDIGIAETRTTQEIVLFALLLTSRPISAPFCSRILVRRCYTRPHDKKPMPQIKSSNLQVNSPIEARAPDTSLLITADRKKPLPVGVHTFQLQVVDDSDNASQGSRVRVIVVDDKAPTAVITAPERVPFGSSFTLSGERSVETGGGKIVKYIWTLVS